MAFGRAGDRIGRAIFTRVVGSERGTEFSHLAVATIRAVAQGVIGVALIQAILVGVCLLIAGVPWAGVLAGIVFVLGLAQVPAVLVTLAAIAYLWMSGPGGGLCRGGSDVDLSLRRPHLRLVPEGARENPSSGRCCPADRGK